MANYSFIHMSLYQRTSKEKRIESFDYILRQCVLKALDDRWAVNLAPWEDDGPTWAITLPGTACKGPAAMERLLAPDEDVGFPVSIQPIGIAFRHSMNMFTNWAQGRVAEQLSDHFRKGIYFDSTDEIRKPGTKVYRVGKTFRAYLSHGLDNPLSDEDEKYLDRYRRLAPDGFW